MDLEICIKSFIKYFDYMMDCENGKFVVLPGEYHFMHRFNNETDGFNLKTWIWLSVSVRSSS